MSSLTYIETFCWVQQEQLQGNTVLWENRVRQS